MSNADYSGFVQPDAVPRLSKDMCKMSFEGYPPFLEPLLGMWGPLSKQPVSGISSDGTVTPGLYGVRSEGAPVAEAAAAATKWLAALGPDMRAKVSFPVSSDLWRHWQNTPLILRDPPQLELLEQNQQQRELALEVVRASLSPKGYHRTREVMENNLFLGNLIDMTEVLNQWAFTLTIFGEPSTAEPWGWQLFGHHLSLNCLFIADQMVLSPVFMGVEPDRDVGPENRKLFLEHEESALAMMHALTDSERKKATLYDSMLTADQPPERYHPDDGRQVGGAFQDNRVVPYEGLPVSALDANQKKLLLKLADLFISNMPDGPAEARMREIENNLDATHFAWIGKVNDVDPFYFRIHSPVAMIEFDHHSGIFLANQDPARFHVHTIVRSPNGGDYGKDLLQTHYLNGGHNHSPPGVHSHDGGKTFHTHD